MNTAKHSLESIHQKPKKALILGGGGVAGIAWMTGWLHGAAQKGLDLNQFDEFIGTSAGATVAAQITSKTSLNQLYETHINTEKQVPELNPAIPFFKLLLMFLPAFFLRKNKVLFCKRIATIAKRHAPNLGQQRRAIIKQRLTSPHWPEKELKIMAINGETGETTCFTKHSEVALIDAVMASCAVPGVWPPVDIDNDWFIDGGIISHSNADQALPCQLALSLTPLTSEVKEAATLESNHCKLISISPDKASRKAIGLNPLNPSKRIPAAKAGFNQGYHEATAIIEAIENI